MAVLAVTGDAVTLSADSRTIAPGEWALDTADGSAVVGAIEASDAATVRRSVVAVTGELTVGPGARFGRLAFGPDPGALGLEYAEVILEGPNGDLAAWVIPGTDDTWVVFLHDFAADRTEALRAAGTLATLGYPVIIPVLPGVAELGSWREATVAMEFALASGATDLVLFGFGSGGSAALLAAAGDRHSADVAALVLDSPLLDAATVADARLAEDKVPGFLMGWAKAAATFRFGIDWAALDQVAVAPDQHLPVLIFHGGADSRYPADVSVAYGAAAPRTSVVVVEEAGHGESWNLDPEGYRSALTGFLATLAEGTG